jgi:hypothetical protein
MKEIKFFILTLKVENYYQAFSWICLLIDISFKRISVPFYFSKTTQNYSLFTNFVKAFNFFFIQEILQLSFVLCVSKKSTFQISNQRRTLESGKISGLERDSGENLVPESSIQNEETSSLPPDGSFLLPSSSFGTSSSTNFLPVSSNYSGEFAK